MWHSICLVGIAAFVFVVVVGFAYYKDEGKFTKADFKRYIFIGFPMVFGIMLLISLPYTLWKAEQDYSPWLVSKSYQYRVLYDSNDYCGPDLVTNTNEEAKEIVAQDPKYRFDVEYIIQDWHSLDDKRVIQLCYRSPVSNSTPESTGRQWSKDYRILTLDVNRIMRVQQRVGWVSWVECSIDDIPESAREFVASYAFRGWF